MTTSSRPSGSGPRRAWRCRPAASGSDARRSCREGLAVQVPWLGASRSEGHAGAVRADEHAHCAAEPAAQAGGGQGAVGDGLAVGAEGHVGALAQRDGRAPGRAVGAWPHVYSSAGRQWPSLTTSSVMASRQRRQTVLLPHPLRGRVTVSSANQAGRQRPGTASAARVAYPGGYIATTRRRTMVTEVGSAGPGAGAAGRGAAAGRAGERRVRRGARAGGAAAAAVGAARPDARGRLVTSPSTWSARPVGAAPRPRSCSAPPASTPAR